MLCTHTEFDAGIALQFVIYKKLYFCGTFFFEFVTLLSLCHVNAPQNRANECD